MPAPGETLDRLAGDFCIFQRQGGHRYSTDDLLCAYFATVAVDSLGVTIRRALDLGTGIGSVALLLAWHFVEASIDGIEAQSASAELARRSIRWNGVEARVRIRDGDFRDETAIDLASYDIVTGTPPYFSTPAWTMSADEQRAACRFELRGGVEAYLVTAARAVCPRGVVILVQPWRDRLRVEQCGRESGLPLALSRPVIFKEGRDPALGLFAFQRSAMVQTLPPLVVRTVSGHYSDDYRAVRRRMGYPFDAGFGG